MADYICTCGDTIPIRRFDAGYRICLKCGDRKAQSEIKVKLANVAPLYNKGPLGFLGTTTERAKEVGDSNQRSVSMHGEGVTIHVPGQTPSFPKSKPKKIIPKPIGFVYMGDETNATYIYDRNDPRIEKARRWAIFR